MYASPWEELVIVQTRCSGREAQGTEAVMAQDGEEGKTLGVING